MLQHSVQLSLSSQKIHAAPHDLDYFRPNDLLASPQSPAAILNRKRIQNLPLSISTNLSSPTTTSSSSPSTASAKLPRSPYLSPRQLPPPSPVPFPQQPHVASPSYHSQSSLSSQTLHDTLVPGDVVGEGFYLKGEPIRLVANSDAPPQSPGQEPAQEFEVIKELGTGSYAVVYLVQEVLYRPAVSEDGHMSTIGHMEFDNKSTYGAETVYGRKFAIKCLSKANLDEDALAIQMSEVTIHQSLPLHANIVTLHRTLETSAFLLLLLEYVPGEDLFYFLEQSRDHYELDNAHFTDSSVSASHTPPTPSLLSNLHPSQLLSRTRLRLIASMFGQMCDAVAACHAQQVFHRDIKPENFIVTDGAFTTSDGRLERKVVVKLTDFGLSTKDLESSDMDCGSAPYMSYECRNNVAPTYRPRAADVWSLGIVLINMLYHYNPWTDTAQGACSSFDLFRRDPVNFFMYRFTGMTRPVAEVLATKVFCVLEDPYDDSPRMTAAEFGAWVKNLPNLLGGHGVHRTVSTSSTGHRLSLSIPISHRPSSRPPSVYSTAVRGTPVMPPRSLSRAPSFGPAMEREELSTVIDNENEEEGDEADADADGRTSRSMSTTRRRKRGLRKGKGATSTSPTLTQDETLSTLAAASQTLAREISMASRASSRPPSLRSTSTKASNKPFEPVAMYALPTPLLPRSPLSASSTATATTAVPSPITPSPITKKPSKWKLSFGKNSGSTLANAAAAAGRVSPVEEVSPPPSLDLSSQYSHSQTSLAKSTTASNVTNLLMGLYPPPPPPPQPVPPTAARPIKQQQQPQSPEETSTWTRGRRAREMHAPPPPAVKNTSRSPGYALSQSPPTSSHHDQWSSFQDKRPDRATSPHSTRSGGRPIASSASSVVSGNWRSSMSTTSSAGTSTSAFTRYSNNSARSVSTTATSVSSASWRTSVKTSSTFGSSQSSYNGGNIPRNIKIMDGVPWELDQLPRGQHPNPVGDIFGSPPVRKQRTRKPPKDLKLDTISERPAPAGQRSPENLRRDASTSTTDLVSSPGGASLKDDVDGVKKVQKGQINALAKMLTAFRR